MQLTRRRPADLIKSQPAPQGILSVDLETSHEPGRPWAVGYNVGRAVPVSGADYATIERLE
jgi:hypothetical protein